jgi:hypothetical protein
MMGAIFLEEPYLQTLMDLDGYNSTAPKCIYGIFEENIVLATKRQILEANKTKKNTIYYLLFLI